MKKKILLIPVACMIVLLCGCGREKVHTDKEITRYVDTLQGRKWTNTDTEFQYNLKGKYEFVSEETTYDEEGREVKTVTFRIKDTNLTFTVTSQYMPSVEIDGSVLQSSYQLYNDYEKKALDYYLDEYSSSIGYHYELAPESLHGHLVKDHFTIETQNDLDFAIDYIDGFIDYINDLDMDFLSATDGFGLSVFSLYFPAKEDAMVFYWKYENGNYSYNTHFDDTYDLESDVNEFLEYNDIFLRRLPE